jgi:hypothetical protein
VIRQLQLASAFSGEKGLDQHFEVRICGRNTGDGKARTFSLLSFFCHCYFTTLPHSTKISVVNGDGLQREIFDEFL